MPIPFHWDGTALPITQASATSGTRLAVPEKAQRNTPEVSDD